MQTSSDARYPTPSVEGPRLALYFGLHSAVALVGWFVALMMTDGNALSFPFMVAIAYTVVFGSIVHFLNARGLSLWIWMIGLPLAALFLTWSPPVGWTFLLCLATSFTTIRALEWEDKRWIIPAICYGATILYFMACG